MNNAETMLALLSVNDGAPVRYRLGEEAPIEIQDLRYGDTLTMSFIEPEIATAIQKCTLKDVLMQDRAGLTISLKLHIPGIIKSDRKVIADTLEKMFINTRSAAVRMAEVLDKALKSNVGEMTYANLIENHVNADDRICEAYNEILRHVLATRAGLLSTFEPRCDRLTKHSAAFAKVLKNTFHTT